MQPRRVARELALLAIGQLPSTPQKLSGKQLEDYIIAAVRSLTEEAQEALEVAGDGVSRSEKLLDESDLRLPFAGDESSLLPEQSQSKREEVGERVELARLKQIQQQIGKLEAVLRTADPTRTSASAMLSELFSLAGQLRTSIDSVTQSVEEFDRRLQTARKIMAEAVQSASTAINRLGASVTLPEFVQLAGGAPVKDYAMQLMVTVHEHKTDIDRRLEEILVGWNLNRIGRIERDILRLCVAEMEILVSVPERVAINEAVELAKLYGSKESPTFVNGVLRRLTTSTPKE